MTILWGHDDRILDIAAFRYRLIADAIEAGPGEIGRVLASVASKEHITPSGNRVRFQVRTLWRYLSAYRRGGIKALAPAHRKDRGIRRSLSDHVFEEAKKLRQEKTTRATKSVIDILVRKKIVLPGELTRSTLDRHLDLAGLSRRRLNTLGKKTFQKIKTEYPFELVVVDFHHGPYVRTSLPHEELTLKKGLLCAFIDHYSRYVPESRYYLHEDFVALRFGFRRLLTGYGLPVRQYADNGASFQANRFHAACDALGIQLVHSKAYTSEGRGVIERFNRTVKEQFESEIIGREEPLTLDELNAYWEAWLSERYHRDVHSETGEPPFDRFRNAEIKRAPDLADIDELLRLRDRRTVHKKWSTVEVNNVRYQVDASLRGRRINVLYDPSDPAYVLICFDGRVVSRAYPQKPGDRPPELSNQSNSNTSKTDYLALLRSDFEARTQAELSTLGLRPKENIPELSLIELTQLLTRCRGQELSQNERSVISAFFRKMRPFDPQSARTTFESITRKLGTGLHIQNYLEALGRSVLRERMKPKPTTNKGDKKV